MTYDANHDPYIENSTGILRNLLGSTTQAELDKSEAEITTVVIATLTLYEPPLLSSFTTSLLQDIHREIFGDIYDFAGAFRTIDISKGASYFAHAAYIKQAVDEISHKIKNDERLKSKDKATFVQAMTDYYSELNAIHPFREGNGRTIRTFLRLIAINNGWDIEWSGMKPQENIAACAEAFYTEPILLRALLTRLIVRIR